MEEVYLYLIQLWPDHAPSLYKVGYTRDVTERLRIHRTTAPRLRLVATWRATQKVERAILKKALAANVLVGGEVLEGEEVGIMDLIKEELG